jgi:hypothetical protein
MMVEDIVRAFFQIKTASKTTKVVSRSHIFVAKFKQISEMFQK